MSKQKPYIEKERVIVEKFYNPSYGDDRICECGHSYYRHFDTYEDMDSIGCKYCSCSEFVEAQKIKAQKIKAQIKSKETVIGYKLKNGEFILARGIKPECLTLLTIAHIRKHFKLNIHTFFDLNLDLECEKEQFNEITKS